MRPQPATLFFPFFANDQLNSLVVQSVLPEATTDRSESRSVGILKHLQLPKQQQHITTVIYSETEALNE